MCVCVCRDSNKPSKCVVRTKACASIMMLAPLPRSRLALVLEAGAKHVAAREEVATGGKKRERKQLHPGTRLPDGPPNLSSGPTRTIEKPQPTRPPLHPDMPKLSRQPNLGQRQIAILEQQAAEAREAEEQARRAAEQAMVARMLADAQVEAALEAQADQLAAMKM